ncbi:MAG TPA: RNA polymerase sigma factor [Candidatus Dormibacteraeota bacterium]|nr:RNA polymerase sigma factor [Candidatus Dormibacteraeota bacterium]
MNLSEQASAAVEFSDGEYVESSRNGCPDHFRCLVQRYQKPLFAFLARRLGNELEAEEVAQESFVRAFLALKKLQKPESFYSWLLGIAGRVMKEQFRSRARTRRNREALETLVPEGNGDEPEYELEEALALLPESYRDVLLLRYYEGLSCQEIAAQLAMPLGTVTKTLSRAYAALREQLKNQESDLLTVNNL